ncbi:MAG: hypothetical protein A2Y38_13805 [Spirochaetes bacterium GWB1_59_5]|nr:MAG: hypothetical protein A2Y38_13805 [Spirochaetes bacterium GWB1_59_5]
MAQIVCPSGLTGEIRGLKGKEADILGDRQAAKRGTIFNQVLDACWLRTDDKGVYDFADGAKLVWPKILICDQTVAIMQVRIATYGNEYTFTVQCASEACRKRIEWDIDLSTLVTRALPDASKELYKHGNRFEHELPDGSGKRFWHRLLTVGDAMKASALIDQNPNRVWSTALGLRIIEIEGIKAPDRQRYIQEMDLGAQGDIIEMLDEVDGGIDNEITIECPSCYSQQDVRLPFDGAFLMPPKKRKKKATEQESES